MDALDERVDHDTVVDGFRRIERDGPFFQRLGPAFIDDRDPGRRVLALRIGVEHTNKQGNAHGGMLMTLADGAFHTNLALHYPEDASLVTINMNTNFLSAARVGDWVEAHVRVARVGRSAGFADCDLSAGSRLILRASAVFAVRPR